MQKEPEELIDQGIVRSPDAEPQTPLQRTQEALQQLNGDFNSFAAAVIPLLTRGEKFDQQLADRVIVGRFTSETVDSVGIESDQARVLYGDWTPQGNVEGSMYTRFQRSTLRVRWAGDWAIYLNGWGNYMRIEKGHEDDSYKVVPVRVEGRNILGMTEQGLETEDPQTYPAYVEALWDYQARLAQENGFAGILRRAARRVMLQPAQPLVEPEEPAPIIISHESFQSMVGTMRSGLQRTVYTINQARLR